MLPFIRLEDRSYKIAPGTKVIKAGDYQQYNDAQAMLDDTRRRCDEMNVLAEQKYEDEKARGYNEGLQAWNSEKATQQIKLQEEIQCYYQDVEQEMVDLVMGTVGKIIGKQDNITLVTCLVKKALEQLSQEKVINLRVSPDQLDPLRLQVDSMLDGFTGIEAINVVADNRLQDGDCLLEHPSGTFNASASVQLACLRKALTNSIGSL